MSSIPKDPIAGTFDPDRLFFATGILLSAEDLSDEQTYHRGRLARALAYLHGSGTVAGLKVEYLPEKPATGSSPGQAEQLAVNPGLAIDRLGRLIEVPGRVCIRLDRWYAKQAADDVKNRTDYLKLAWHQHVEPPPQDAEGNPLYNPPFDGVVTDVFLSFEICERGKTPAFAVGPFDALDAVQPSRLRDGYELKLVPRYEVNPPLPRTNWPNLEAITDPVERRSLVHEMIFDSWPRTLDPGQPLNPNQPEPGNEYAEGEDETAVFLARVVIGADTADDPAAPPVRRPVTGDAPPTNISIDNHSRLFAYTTRLLARPYDL